MTDVTAMTDPSGRSDRWLGIVAAIVVAIAVPACFLVVFLAFVFGLL